MLERCLQHQITLNSNKCIFYTPFGILLGHIVWKQGLLVDLANIALILSFPPPTNVKMLRATLGHTGYCRKFIKGYVVITTPMENILEKDDAFVWSPECQGSLDTLKDKMASVPILVFPNWNKEFHVIYGSSACITMRRRSRSLDHFRKSEFFIC